jgi:hypothetical protein
MKPKTITKTDYLKYLECPLYAWLSKNRKDLVEKKEALFMINGNKVENIARGLFPKGTEVKSYYEAGSRDTMKLIENGTKVIYQAQAMTNKFLARADILVKNKNGWHLYEVKAAADVRKKSSGKIKDKYLSDLHFQANAFKLAGIELESINLIYTNNQYIYNTKKGLELDTFLIVDDLTDEIKMGMPNALDEMDLAYKNITSKNQPEVIRQKKFEYGLTPLIKKEYYKDIPEFSIYDIAGIDQGKIIKLAYQGGLLMKDVIDNGVLTPPKMKQVDLTMRKGRDIDKEEIKDWLDQLEFPLYFFDYETMPLAVPFYDKTKPFQQVPMQYSLHVLSKPDGMLEHYEYVHTDQSDPFEPLCKSFREHVGDKGSVISWHMSFEVGRNKEMAEIVPEYKDFLLDVNRRTLDLKDVFKDMYVDYRFKGSASLKSVVPVLLPKLTYSNLDIQGGLDASLTLYKMLFEEVEDREKTTQWLLDYCERDTEVMVRLYELLLEIK